MFLKDLGVGTVNLIKEMTRLYIYASFFLTILQFYIILWLYTWPTLSDVLAAATLFLLINSTLLVISKKHNLYIVQLLQISSFSANRISILEKRRKNIPKTTFILMSAYKKSLLRIKSPLAYLEASFVQIISFY